MVDINPIRALRPSKEKAEELVCHPYDVMDREEARQMADSKPASFLRIIRSDLEFPDSVSPYSDEVYERSVSNLKDFISKGWLERESDPCYYVYRLNSGEIQQTGLVAGSAIADYANDKIKKHEFTRPEKEKDRTTHIDRIGVNTGPVFLLYPDSQNPQISKTLDHLADSLDSLYDVTFEDGVRHRVYRIEPGSEQSDLTQAFAKLDATYIADGHHRAASAYKNGQKRKEAQDTKSDEPCSQGDESCSQGSSPWNYFLTVIFPDHQLAILPYNRVVQDLNGLSEDGFLNKVKENFTLSEGKKEIEGPYDINMYLNQKWYALQALAHSYEGKNETDSLAVGVLQDVLLAPVLGIDDPRTSNRIKFVGGIRGDQELEKLVDNKEVARKEIAVAFSMPAVTTKELINIADAGRTMPPKSTWFEPKLRSGLASHVLDF